MWRCGARAAPPGPARPLHLHPGRFPGTMFRLCRLVGALPGVTRAMSITIPAEPTTFSSRRAVRHVRASFHLTRRLYSMAVVIRMMRAGAKKRPFYRVVVADSRSARDSRSTTGSTVRLTAKYSKIAWVGVAKTKIIVPSATSCQDTMPAWKKVLSV